jgi:AbrB family looped-hinge helix DNA binding protein
MKAVTLSSKAQIVLPKDVREAAGLEVGARLVLVPEGHIIHIVPVRDIDHYRGWLAGAATTGLRDREPDSP